MAKPKKKLGKAFYFSVEGETEKWYLEWLQKTINEKIENGNIKIIAKVEKDPRRFVKTYGNISPLQVTHLYDYEGSAQEQLFRQTIDHIKTAEQMKSRISYQMGYSNLTFDLWIILHKANCNASYIQQGQYLPQINRAYGESFQRMDAYKEEANFKRLLGKLTFADVLEAIERAKRIEGGHSSAGHIPQHHRNFTYYRENPSLSIHERIEELLKDVGLL